MSTDQVHLERRGAQRFDFHLPVSVRLARTDHEGHGFTQDLSARGALFYTDFALNEGDAIELTLVMPSEITLAENMRVRCRGKVVRVAKPAVGSRAGVAVHLEGYEFLPDADTTNESATSFGRISALHGHKPQEPEAVEPPAAPRPALVP